MIITIKSLYRRSGLLYLKHAFVLVYVHVGVKFKINFTSWALCNFFAILATMSAIYPKISLLHMLSQK